MKVYMALDNSWIIGNFYFSEGYDPHNSTLINRLEVDYSGRRAEYHKQYKTRLANKIDLRNLIMDVWTYRIYDAENGKWIN